MKKQEKRYMPNSFVICSDNLAYLKTLPDNSIDSIVTDPPYGLGDEPDPLEVLKDWIEKGYHEVKAKGGFMGKSWDSFVPQPNFWKEVFRVLKPGGHLLSFGGTRTYDWMVMSLRLGGFEIRDCLQWVYASGFPKSMNISKAIDKAAGAEREVISTKITTSGGLAQIYKANNEKDYRPNSYNEGGNVIKETLPATEDAEEWNGWGTALKPAYEPIVLARKPIAAKTIIENVLAHSTGGINIDACRISFTGKKDLEDATFGRSTDILSGNYVGATHGNGLTNIEANPKGRWPANFLTSHHPGCIHLGENKIKGSLCNKSSDCSTGTGVTPFRKMQGNRPARGYGDENNQETVDHYDCHPDCPIRILDEQSGVLKSGVPGGGNKSANTNEVYNKFGSIPMTGFGDKGGASRFFYCAKASRSERNNGLENFDEKFFSMRPNSTTEQSDKGDMTTRLNSKSGMNIHPTVKPVKLMQYLVKLITPPGGRCLDTFNGSGTTGIACKLEGFDYLGIESIQEHCDISVARIAAWEPEPEDYDNQLSLFPK